MATKLKTQNSTPIKSGSKLKSVGIKDNLKSNSGLNSNTPKKSQEPQTMDELFSQTGYSFKTYKRGDSIEGNIISASPNEVLVDIGAKSFAQVNPQELEYIRDLVNTFKVGDKINATVVYPENELGYMVISLRNLGYEKRWDYLKEKYDKDMEVEVKGLETAKGGVIIDYAGIRGFIPASQLDPSVAGEPQRLKNKKIKVKILELSKKNTRLVVSQKAVTQKGLIQKQKEALDKFEVGKQYKATATGVAPFGIFVLVPTDKEGIEIEGLIHISEIAWEKVEDPQKYVKTGDKITAVVIGIDKLSGRLNLSLKQMTPDPWKDIEKRYKTEQQIKGLVTRISSFGAFVNLENGIEGLIHISKIPPGEEPKEGDKVECVIETIDPLKRKISLSLVPKAKPVGYR